MPVDPIYRVRQVRLINFHNFVDETIAVPNGGHLFLLGDNGSGKTTLLDAIHLVLSANEAVEFNAAARVAGSAREGRRLQGIILRQNIESAAPLNPAGGITYAALELLDGRDKPLCLVLGLEAHAADDQIRYWGAVWSGALADLPLFTAADGQRYPATWRELRERVGSAFCADLKSFRQMLVQRVYGSEALFGDTCRLLRMGKAYREIAASTGDYHKLFQQLLPEPQRALFEEVIRTLRELDQSQSDLAGLQQKQTYLEELAGTVQQIDRLREAQLRYTWLTHHLTRRDLDGQMTTCRQTMETAEGERAAIRQAIATEEARRDSLRKDLAGLQQRDAGATLTLLEERRREEGALARAHGDRQTELKAGEQARAAAERVTRQTLESWRKQVGDTYAGIHQLRTQVPISLPDLLGALDAMQRSEAITEEADFDTSAPATQTQEALTALGLEAHDQQAQRDAANRAMSRCDEEIADLTARAEIAPDIPGYREATRALDEQMIRFAPLYRGLEWAPGVSPAARAVAEEAIGPKVLATLVVAGDDYAAATQLVFPHYRGIRLANRDAASADPPAWITATFSVADSNPAAIRVLAEEMSASQHPSPRLLADAQVLAFRAHERRLIGGVPALIGEKHRREALRVRLRELQDERKAATQQAAACEKALVELQSRRASLERLASLLRDVPMALSNARHVALRASSDAAGAARRVEEQRTRAEGADAQLQACRRQVADLQARISQEGLDALEKRQRKVERDLRDTDAHLQNLHESEGAVKTRLEGHAHHLEHLRGDAQAQDAARAACEARLAPLAVGVESVAYYVLRTWRGQQFERVENVQAEMQRASREEAEAIGMLRARLNHPTFGAVYAFAYDESRNLLVDRHASPIADVVTTGQRQIDEQRSVINEKTQTLIRDLVMGDLFSELKGSVRRLREMVRATNHLLNGRSFGGTRYRFHMEEEKRYRGLLRAIEQYNPLDPAARQEMEGFLDTHRNEIMATDVNEVPAALDYRNWFECQLRTGGEEVGGVVMDRRTKSLGSGGEQAVPNYLLILTVAHFLYEGNAKLRIRSLLFDEAFYGIDAGRRDQLLGFASDIGLQLFVASPDLDGVKQEIPCSTTLLVVKDEACDVHLSAYDFTNPRQLSLLDGAPDLAAAEFEPALEVPGV